MDITPSSATAPPDAGQPTVLITARRLAFTVPSASGPVNILQNLDLEVRRNEAIAIVGASGSGKTSLLMLLAGLEPPTGGTLHFDGLDLSTASENALAQLRRNRLGIVFQSFHLIPSMTALENVAVPLELAGHPHAVATARAALGQVGLGHRLTHLPGQLSGGEQQRVAIARAIAPRPDLLLADEPTGNLDQETGAKVIDLLFHLRADLGATLVLVTHDPALAARCSRTLHLVGGRLAHQQERPGAPPLDPAKGAAFGIRDGGSR